MGSFGGWALIIAARRVASLRTRIVNAFAQKLGGTVQIHNRNPVMSLWSVFRIVPCPPSRLP
jgi:hypothetical protein